MTTDKKELKYYFVSMPNFAPARVTYTHDAGLPSDLQRKRKGNYFLDKEEAELACRAVNKVFRVVLKTREQTANAAAL